MSRTNFSESFQILVHLKVVRLYVESVLRYGLPANYVGIIIKVRLPTYSRIHIFPITPAFPSPTRKQPRRHSTYCKLTSHISAPDPTALNPRRKWRAKSLSGNIRTSWNKNSLTSCYSKSHGLCIRSFVPYPALTLIYLL